MSNDFNSDEAESELVKFLPTLKDYERRYGVSLAGNDKKALRCFREYESKERVRRLQSELLLIKQGKVTEKACTQVVGKKRLAKYGSYEEWAKLMLLWLSEK